MPLCLSHAHDFCCRAEPTCSPFFASASACVHAHARAAIWAHLCVYAPASRGLSFLPQRAAAHLGVWCCCGTSARCCANSRGDYCYAASWSTGIIPFEVVFMLALRFIGLWLLGGFFFGSGVAWMKVSMGYVRIFFWKDRFLSVWGFFESMLVWRVIFVEFKDWRIAVESRCFINFIRLACNWLILICARVQSDLWKISARGNSSIYQL